MAKSVRLALLERARDLAGGVSFLGRRLGIGSNALDEMLVEKAEIPHWLFLRAVQFTSDAEESRQTPPGFPADWLEQLRGGRSGS